MDCRRRFALVAEFETVSVHGGLRAPPKPPGARGTPAKPWRPSTTRFLHGLSGFDLIAVGRYEPTGEPDTAKVALVVQDGWQQRGLGTLLFQEVLGAATARGIRRFRA